jgi:hypothetical protein
MRTVLSRRLWAMAAGTVLFLAVVLSGGFIGKLAQQVHSLRHLRRHPYHCPIPTHLALFWNQ